MSNRMSRVNGLLQREISEQLHRYYSGKESVRITISGVSTSPDLRQSNIYYSVIGDAQAIAASDAFFRRIGKELRQRVMQRVTLKYFPRFEFIYDPSMERGSKIVNLIEELNYENEQS